MKKRDGPWKWQRAQKTRRLPATSFKAKEGLPSGQGLDCGTWDSPGNKLTGIPSPALLLGAAILRLSISILRKLGLSRGPGWDSGCVCARAKKQLQGVTEGSGGGRECERAPDTHWSGHLGRSGTECFLYFHYRSP